MDGECKDGLGKDGHGVADTEEMAKEKAGGEELRHRV